MKKILIAGTNSGVGKTTISLGIMQALTKRNLKVQPYKVGPDYIDPSYHTFITGRYSRNLDSYMLDDEKIKYIVKNASKDADISVIEGVMGLYDGYGIDLTDSVYLSEILNGDFKEMQTYKLTRIEYELFKCLNDCHGHCDECSIFNYCDYIEDIIRDKLNVSQLSEVNEECIEIID